MDTQTLLHDTTLESETLIGEGKRCLKKNDVKSAAQSFGKAYAENNESSEAAINYALTLIMLNELPGAIKILRTVVAKDKKNINIVFMLAYILTEFGMKHHIDGYIKEAVHYYTNILSYQHDDIKTINNLGLCLLYLQQAKNACRCFVRAIRLESNNAVSYNNLALVARLENLAEQSANCCRKAIEFKPDYAEAYNNLGNALKDLNDIENAISAYQQAVTLDPRNDFKCNLGIALLTMGNFQSGWELYAWRDLPSMSHSPRAAIKQWNGEEGHGKTLLISSEQGFGDTIQFCRYASMAKARGFRVIVKAQKPLVRLLESLQGADAVVANPKIEDVDYQIPMLNLPLVFHTDMDSIPSPGTYLFATNSDINYWKTKLADVSEYRVGLVWSGQTRQHSSDFGFTSMQRSMPAACFLPLMERSGVRYFNLQKGEPQAPDSLDMLNYMDACHDFADTAALIMNLDLIITVDTAVAHLAGALGKPVWVLNRFSGCWRWLRGRTDSPWYPTLRLFTQTAPGDWAGVMARVSRALSEEISAAKRTATVHPVGA